jgi:hypothetical protein
MNNYQYICNLAEHLLIMLSLSIHMEQSRYTTAYRNIRNYTGRTIVIA